MSLVRLACALILLCLVAPPVRADDGAEAERLFVEGQRLYDEGRFDDAVARWSEGFELSHAPAFLYNIAQAHRLAGRCEESLAFYRQFRAAEPDAPGAQAVDRRIEEMEGCVADREAARHRAEEREREPAPATAPPVPLAPIDEHPGRTKRWIGLGLMAVSVGAAAGSIYYAVDARDASQEIDGLYRAGGTWEEQYWDIEARGERAEKRALWLGVGAGVLLGAGATLLWMGSNESGAVTVTAKGVSWSGTF